MLCYVQQKGPRELGTIKIAAQLQQQVADMGLAPAVQADLLSAF